MTKKYDIMWSEELDSTNEEARRRISDLDNLSVLSVERQTAGRGQRGNSWRSAPGENLTFSIILKFRKGDASSDESSCDSAVLPQLKAVDQFVLSEISSLALVRLLENHGIRASVKWPNDIYIGSCKVCGMLIENSILGSSVSSSIIGIGLNVNQRNFDINLPNPTSMAIVSGIVTDIRKALEEITDTFRSICETMLASSEGRTRLHSLYLSRLWRLDEEHSYVETATGKAFTGTIKGVSPTGRLLIETADGSLMEFAFKEISYII